MLLGTLGASLLGNILTGQGVIAKKQDQGINRAGEGVLRASYDSCSSKTDFYSMMCGYFCIGFIDFMLAGKTLTEFTNLFSPNNFKKNDDIVLNYFMNNVYKWLNAVLLNAIPLSMILIKHQICTQI